MNQPVNWCPTCSRAVDVEYAELKLPSAYVKFDLTKEALASFPELAAIARREGVVRVSLASWTAAPWALVSNRCVALNSGVEYVAIKAPTLDGTEIWIVAREAQEKFELAAGFGKVSKPLFAFPAEKLRGQAVRALLDEGYFPIVISEAASAELGTGVIAVPNANGLQGKSVVDQVEAVMSSLEETGHLVCRDEASGQWLRCGKCLGPVIVENPELYRSSVEAHQ